MKMKKTAVLLTALLLLAGCQVPGEQESGEPSFPSAESGAVSRTSSSLQVIPLPEDSSAETEESIALPVPPDPVVLEELLVFTFPEGWTQAEGEGLFAQSPDGNTSVQGSFTPMDSMQGLTGEMLASAACDDLQKAWEGAGLTGVTADLPELTVGGVSCAAVSLQGVSGGTAVFQYQAYLLTENGFLTITVTTYAEDQRAVLLNCFSGV